MRYSYGLPGNRVNEDRAGPPLLQTSPTVGRAGRKNESGRMIRSSAPNAPFRQQAAARRGGSWLKGDGGRGPVGRGGDGERPAARSLAACYLILESALRVS